MGDGLIVSEERPPPNSGIWTQPARATLHVRVVTVRDPFPKRVAKVLGGLTVHLVLGALVGVESLDLPSRHRFFVQVAERDDHQVVYEQDWGHDAQGAGEAERSISADLARLPRRKFYEEYGIELRRAGARPAPGLHRPR